jgi:hypothetical protein
MLLEDQTLCHVLNGEHTTQPTTKLFESYSSENCERWCSRGSSAC